MTKFILHIGRHKTGTTSIQETLAKNADALAKHGIDYPLFKTDKVAHHKIATHLTNSAYHHFDDQADAFAYYKEYVDTHANSSDGRLAIFSSEAFQYVDPKLVADIFPPRYTRVIGYVREQASYAVSAYCQGVQTEKIIVPLNEYARIFHVDYFDFANRWRTIFGIENVEFRIFDRSLLFESDIVADFFHLINKDDVLKQLYVYTDENISIGGPIVEINRMLNTTQLDKGELTRRFYVFFSMLARSEKSFRAKPCLSYNILRDLWERHRATNEKLFESIGQGNGSFPKSAFCKRARPLTDVEISKVIKQCAECNKDFKDLALEHFVDCKPLDLIGRNLFDMASLN
jgi:hypothetical protein